MQFKFALQYLFPPVVLLARLKRVLQRSHFVKDAAHRPEVRLGVVRLVLPNLGAQVVGRAHAGAGVIFRPVEDPCDAEIPEFKLLLTVIQYAHRCVLKTQCSMVRSKDADNNSPGNEDVLGLDVSVQDFSLMDVLHGPAELCEVREDVGFGYEVAAPMGYLRKEVSAITIFHDNVEGPERIPYSLYFNVNEH